MALDITATITCDMCGRSDTRPLRESMRHGKLATVERRSQTGPAFNRIPLHSISPRLL